MSPAPNAARPCRPVGRLGTLVGASLPLLLWVASSAAEAADGKKKNEGAALLLVLLPVGVLVAATLQMAVMAAFPRFARRCAAAVSRLRWQTPLAGFAAFLGTLLLVAVANWAAHGNQQAGAPALAAAALVTGIGGVGVSLVAGRWALRRVQPDAPAHPLLEVLAGASLLGWAMILVPCAGQALCAVAACASLGAFVVAVLLGRRLDEARSWRDMPPSQSPPAAPVADAAPEPPEPGTLQPGPAGEPDHTSGAQMF